MLFRSVIRFSCTLVLRSSPLGCAGLLNVSERCEQISGLMSRPTEVDGRAALDGHGRLFQRCSQMNVRRHVTCRSGLQAEVHSALVVLIMVYALMC